MRFWVRVVVRLLFGAGDVWTSVRWLTSDGVTACVNLGAPEYAALTFLFTGGLIAVSWEPLGKLCDVVMQQCSPVRRTYALLDDFKTLERTLAVELYPSFLPNAGSFTTSKSSVGESGI